MDYLTYRWTNIVYLFYTTYSSVNLAHHEIFLAKVGIKDFTRFSSSDTFFIAKLYSSCTLHALFLLSRDPNIGDNGQATLTQWPEYNTDTQSYIRFKANMTSFPVENFYVASRVRFWNTLVPQLNENCGKKCKPCN